MPAVEIRKPGELGEVAGLIMPGGESTTLLKLMDAWDFFPALEKFHAAGNPIFGTCAGLILLARDVQSPAQRSLGFIDITAERNAYGRQKESFETEVTGDLGAGPGRSGRCYPGAPHPTDGARGDFPSWSTAVSASWPARAPSWSPPSTPSSPTTRPSIATSSTWSGRAEPEPPTGWIAAPPLGRLTRAGNPGHTLVRPADQRQARGPSIRRRAWRISRARWYIAASSRRISPPGSAAASCCRPARPAGGVSLSDATVTAPSETGSPRKISPSWRIRRKSSSRTWPATSPRKWTSPSAWMTRCPRAWSPGPGTGCSRSISLRCPTAPS